MTDGKRDVASSSASPEEIHSSILAVLERGYLMSLGTVDDGGVWVADVIYIHDDQFTLSWISHDQTRHSQAIAANPQVAVTITADERPAHEFAVQLTGTATRLDGEHPVLALKHLRKRGKLSLADVENALNPDHAWYQLTPSRIELIDAAKYGFKKQKLEL